MPRTRSVTLIVTALLSTSCATPPPTGPHSSGAVVAPSDMPPVQNGPIGEGDRPPKPIYMQNPVYPYDAKRLGIQGVVVVEFIIGKTGTVIEAHAIQSPHPSLAKAAVEAVLASRYEPALRHGKPTGVRMRTPIKFELLPAKKNEPPS